MQLRSVAAFSLALAAAAPAARANDPMPGFPWIGHGDGAALSDEAPKAAELGCPLDDTAAKRALLATFVAHAKATTDPEARQVFPAYAPQLQAWFERWVAGVPGYGTWDQAKATFDQAARLVAVAKESQDPQYVIDHIAEYGAAVALERDFEKLATIIDNGPCGDRLGKTGDLRWRLSVARSSAQRAATDVMPMLAAYNFPPRPDASPAPTTYWKHVEWVKARVDYAGGLGKMRATVDQLRPLAPLSTTLAARLAELDAELAAADAVVAEAVAQLRLVKMPRQKVDKARAKVVAKSFVGWTQGQQIGLVVGAPGVAKASWKEEVEVRRTSDKIYYRVYPTARESYVVHEGYRPTPATATAPALPGLAAADICELRAQEFTRFTKGPPSFGRTWHETFFGVTGYLPCANVGELTTMKME